MTRYELQKAIFKMTMDLYPHYQHSEVYEKLQKLWKKDTKTIVAIHCRSFSIY